MDTKKLPARLRKHAFSLNIPYQAILSIFRKYDQDKKIFRKDRNTNKNCICRIKKEIVATLKQELQVSDYSIYELNERR